MYIKSDKEQKFHLRMLIDANKILAKHHITAILTNSALLGIYRDKNLIPWSMGVLLSSFYEQLKPKIDILTKEFKKAGFRISKIWPGKNCKIRIKKGKFNVEIVGYLKGDKYYYRKLQNKLKIIPREFLDPPYSRIKFSGFKFIVPKNIEKFLSFIYLDWRTPHKSRKAPSKYKTKNHMVIKK